MGRSYLRLFAWSLATSLPATMGCAPEPVPQCDEVDDPREPPELPITVENQRSEPVYLASRTGCAEPKVELWDAEAHVVQSARSCEAQFGANSCAPAVGVKILPGGQYTLQSEAAAYVEPTCQLAGDTCQWRVPLADGTYQLHVGWYASMYGGADCTVTEGTTCTVPFVAGGGERQVATLAWHYPAEGPLTLVIQ